MRLIDADALSRALAEMWYDSPISVTGVSVSELINKQPTIDAVSVVRCKECKHCMYDADGDVYRCLKEHIEHTLYDANKHFCSYAERSDNGKDIQSTDER